LKGTANLAYLSAHYFTGFEGIASVQSVAFTTDSTAYATVDVAEGQGGIVVVEGMGAAESMMIGMGSIMMPPATR